MVRVHEIATDLEVPSGKVLEVLAAIGVEAKSHMSSISDADTARVKQVLTQSSRTVRGTTVRGKRDFRVKDILSPQKTSSVRPRPTLQQKEATRRIVTRKVIKRVVRRGPAQEETAARPELPDVDKALQNIDRSMTSIGGPPVKEKAPAKPEVPRIPDEKPSVPRDRDESQKKGQRSRRDRRKKRPEGGRPPSGRNDSVRPGTSYAPVGKGAAGKEEIKRPPRPKVPRIPSPQDYLKPKEGNLRSSMEKLARGGMRSEIDKKPGRPKPAGGSPSTSDRHPSRKRRRKIIAGDKGRKPPQGGRGRTKESKTGDRHYGSSGVRRRGRRSRGRDRAPKAPPPVPVQHKIRLGEHTSIRELSAQTGLKSSEIIGFLMKELEIFATINQVVDQEIGGLICDHFAFEYEMKKVIEVEDILKREEDKPEDLIPRSPVVTVLGHVDHGKTKLLDAIRGTDVVATEAGGITQKIGAFQVDTPMKDGGTRSVTFIDTPGHAAFTAMRARGAMVTDIAVLVVAANDGVMPQTLEAIDHARSANVEIIVAINKIDLAESNIEVVKQQLSEQGLVPEEWGGQVIMVPISAKKKIGIEELLENILTVADIMELKGNPDALAAAYVIEARLDRGRGALATVLVQRGTLDVGDYVIAGRSWGRIRQMTDESGNAVKVAGPSTPIMISGLNTVPQAGDRLNEVVDEKTAREIFDKRETDHRQGRLRMVNTISLEDFYEKMSKGEAKELNIILKADLQGSIEALRGQLEQLSTDEVGVKFIHTAVGNITDSDIMLAMASKAIILGFNVVASPEIRKQASMEGVDIRTYNIIYKAAEDIQAALEGLLEPEYKEQITGRAEVRQIFKKTGKMIVAGLYVNEGKLIRGADVRVLRDGDEITKLVLSSLKRFKDDVREVESGYECGIMLDGFTDLREGDELVAFETIKILRTLATPRTV